MADASTLPRSLVVLGDALRPVFRRIADRMADAPAQVGQSVEIGEFASRHLRMLETDVAKLEDEINGELGSATAPGTSDADVWRAAARMEVHVERILDNFDDVRRVKPGKGDARGFSLLGDIYCALLEQIQTWLNEIVDVIDDPLAAVRKRGLPTQGNVDITIRLTLETPPEIRSLARWAKRRNMKVACSARGYSDLRQYEEADQVVRSRDYSLLALVLAAFGLGWLIGGDGDE